jgi:uncharacterized damage-inducible protein DinB
MFDCSMRVITARKGPARGTCTGTRSRLGKSVAAAKALQSMSNSRGSTRLSTEGRKRRGETYSDSWTRARRSDVFVRRARDHFDFREKTGMTTDTRMGGTRITDALIAELEQEADTTRRVLERVPEGELSWTPHPKSMTLGQLALHVAGLVGGVARLLDPPAAELPNVPLVEATSRSELLSVLDENVAIARKLLASWQDDGLLAEWKMMNGDETLLALPRLGMVRSIMLNHWYHHRGQLVVYLRILDVPLPAVYGPSADENPFA